MSSVQPGNTPRNCFSPLKNWYRAVRDVASGARRESSFEYRRSFPSEQEAIRAFQEAEDRLEHPNRWSQLGHPLLGADFQLFRHNQDQPEEVTPVLGDHIKIKLPDPGPPVWVKLEGLDKSEDSLRFVVRPSDDPRRGSPQTIVHLFGQETTNVFELERDGTTVISRVTGKDEVPNTTGNVFQDVLAGARLAGAWAGLKKPQWNDFVRNLVDGPPSQTGLARLGIIGAVAAVLGMQQPAAPENQVNPS